MNKRWQLILVMVGLIGLISLIGLGQGVAPKGIIPTPPESQALQVKIWVDKGAYAVGEPITIHYSVNKQAYVYIWDIEPDGTAHPLFPNTQNSNNLASPGKHVVPGNWKIAPPLGREYLQILATTTPIDLFAFMTSDPDAFRKQVQAHVLGIVPETDRTWDFTSFEIVSGTPPAYGTLVVNSTPSLAQVYVDGVYVGYTPRTVHVAQGYHQVLVRKTGYNDWTSGLFVIAGYTRTINVTLTPSAPTNQPPVAAFSYLPTNPTVGQQILFQGASSYDSDGTVISYYWNFGDGQTSGPSGASSVYHQYSAAGTYTVTLTVTDNGGLTNSVSHTVQVGVPNQPPVAAFSFSPTNPLAGQQVRFDGSASFDPNGTITAYNWNFGDGATSGAGAVVYHQYSTAGTYTVTLTVTDNGGLTSSVTHTVQVGTPNQPPVAAFSFSPANPTVGAWIRFDGSASSDPNGTITAYNWNFGDGGTSSAGAVVYHQYSTAGTYTVTLTVTDNGGLTNSVSHTVVVGTPNQPPVAAFSFSPANPTVGAWIRFDGSASSDPNGTITAYNWDFGDGTTSSAGAVVYHQYSAAGTYTVVLTVTDNGGLTNSVTHTVQVGTPNQPPVAAFNYTPAAPVVGQEIVLNAAPSYAPNGTITAYRWDLDNNGVDDATGQIVSVRYYNPGVHMVRLTVVDNHGVSASVTEGINVSAAGGAPSAGPAMDGTAGIFVWGTDTWHITVNAGTGWTTSHAYRLELRTDGTFTNVNRTATSGVAPLGVIPAPSNSGKTLVFDGSIRQGSIDYTFKVSGAKSIYMNLQLDVNGDGTLDSSPGIIHLRNLMVNPPVTPFVVGLPQGSSGPLVPSINFRIGRAIQYTPIVRFIFWLTDIATLEGS